MSGAELGRRLLSEVEEGDLVEVSSIDVALVAGFTSSLPLDDEYQYTAEGV